MSKLEKTVCQMLDKKERFVMATILSHEGSTPRTAGTKMIICQDGKIIGTIGGGMVSAVSFSGIYMYSAPLGSVECSDL